RQRADAPVTRRHRSWASGRRRLRGHDQVQEQDRHEMLTGAVAVVRSGARGEHAKWAIAAVTYEAT
ncbi:MAG: hypothetical protein JWM95_1415, partial [Gemmatimonadetes bacterium]|nr:hypothetical protein [Gemmatimonadota bacterium]